MIAPIRSNLGCLFLAHPPVRILARGFHLALLLGSLGACEDAPEDELPHDELGEHLPAVEPGASDMAGDATRQDDTPEDADQVLRVTKSKMPGCDAASAGVRLYRKVYSGASFDLQGRQVYLENDAADDLFSRVHLVNGRPGDYVWIDRSLTKMRVLTPKYHKPDDNVRKYGGGWKQCGPFAVNRAATLPSNTWTQLVYAKHYAVRACVRVNGRSECGKWTIDQ